MQYHSSLFADDSDDDGPLSGRISSRYQNKPSYIERNKEKRGEILGSETDWWCCFENLFSFLVFVHMAVYSSSQFERASLFHLCDPPLVELRFKGQAKPDYFHLQFDKGQINEPHSCQMHIIKLNALYY